MSSLDLESKHEIVEDMPMEQIITDEFITKFEKQAELYQQRYLPICIKLTNEADWVIHGSGDKAKFSLQCSGAEKLCNPLGVIWDRPMVIKHEREDEKGRFYEYEVEGIVQSKVLKRWGWFTGNCDSRDAFFVARGNFAEGDIRKAAFSNWLVNAVTRLAGIRNPSRSMLEKAGLKAADIGSINYRGDKTAEQSGDVISEPQSKRLWAICKQNNVDELTLKAIIKRPPWSYDSSKDIKRAHYDAIVTTVENWKPAGNGQQTERVPGQEG